MSRKNMPLLIGMGAVLLLVVLLGYVLINVRGSYEESHMALNQAQRRLNDLSSRPVFPSAGNVQALREQQEIFEDYLDGLFAFMREGQRPMDAPDRDRFRQLLEQTLNRLVQNARAKNITLPPDFAFGFQRYVAGNPPADGELGRLADQLRSVAILCQILYDAGIGELVSVERTVFERDAMAAPPPVEEEFVRRRGRGREEPEAPVVDTTALVRDPDGLFTRERYVLTYRAQDATQWTVLERLSRGSPFVVVTKVDITNSSRPAVVPPRTEAAAPGAGAAPGGPAAAQRPGAARETEILPRELRVVAGQEMPLVRLEVDVYQFVDASVATGEESL